MPSRSFLHPHPRTVLQAAGRIHDDALARRAGDNLAAYPQVTVVCADGTRFDSGPADAIYVCAGVTGPSATWLDNLAPAGRLIVPLTTATWEGWIREVRRVDTAFAARSIVACGFIPCTGARDAESEELLAEALERGGLDEVRSLRRDRHRREPGCWLHAGDYCLSRNPP